MDKKNVIFTDNLSVNMWANYPCRISTAPTRYNKHSVAYAFQKNSTFIKVFDNVIDRLKETGPLSRMRRNKLKFRPLPNCKDDRQWSIGYQNIFSAFVLSGIGCLMTISIWAFEHMFCSSWPRGRDNQNTFPNSHFQIRRKIRESIEKLHNVVDTLEAETLFKSEALCIGVLQALVEELECNSTIKTEA